MKRSALFNELKRRIVFFDYKPRQMLNIKDLSKEFGVSAIPIREALIRLEDEKLINIIPNNGAYVMRFKFSGVKGCFRSEIIFTGDGGEIGRKKSKTGRDC